MAEVIGFVGRYLNAARLGRDALDAAHIRSAKDVPNACDACKYRQSCHSAFESSSEGHGIYPFNKPALRRAIHARPAHDSPTAFNPRAVIGEVVRNVLVEHAEALGGGTFPDDHFRTEYPTAESERPLSAAVRDTLDDLDPLNPERRATFLEFWGDAPVEPVNLAPVLHHAFDISLLDLDVAEIVTPGPPDDSPPPGEPSTALPNSVRRMINDVEEWASRDHLLPQNTAAALRGLISDAVVRRCMWNDPLMSEPTADVLRRAWPVKSVVVSIQRAAAENSPGTADAPIKFKRNAANAVFFQGILRAQAGRLPGAAEQVRKLSEIADRYQDALKRSVQRVQAVTDPDLVTALRASLIGAALAGRAWPGKDESILLDAALDDGRTWAYADTAIRTRDWLSALDRHRAARPELVSAIRAGFGISRGVTGGVRMIDTARAMPLLRSAAESWEWRTPDTEPAQWVRKAVARFADWDKLIDGEIALLTEQLSRIRSYLPKGVRPSETLDAIGEALIATIQSGHAPDDRERFEAMMNDARARDWRTIDRLENELGKACAPDQSPDHRHAARIIAAARDRGGDLATILAFLSASDQWLTDKLRAAAMQEGGAEAVAAAGVRDLLARWAEIASGAEDE
jgi:hypothetical protein